MVVVFRLPDDNQAPAELSLINLQWTDLDDIRGQNRSYRVGFVNTLNLTEDEERLLTTAVKAIFAEREPEDTTVPARMRKDRKGSTSASWRWCPAPSARTRVARGGPSSPSGKRSRCDL